MPDPGSIQVLLTRWQSGDQEAAAEIHRRYAERLLRLAQAQLGKRLQRRVGPDDIVQSVFKTFFRRTGDGELIIDHSQSLWRLLVCITLNKIRRKAEFHHAARRDVDAEAAVDDAVVAIEAIAREPTAEEAVALADEIDFALAGSKGNEPEILGLTLQGFSPREIAKRLGCSRWTVQRVLKRVGDRLRARFDSKPENQEPCTNTGPFPAMA